MTETQVYELMRQKSGGVLPTDRFGFIKRKEDEAAAAAAAAARLSSAPPGGGSSTRKSVSRLSKTLVPGRARGTRTNSGGSTPTSSASSGELLFILSFQCITFGKWFVSQWHAGTRANSGSGQSASPAELRQCFTYLRKHVCCPGC